MTFLLLLHGTTFSGSHDRAASLSPLALSVMDRETLIRKSTDAVSRSIPKSTGLESYSSGMVMTVDSAGLAPRPSSRTQWNWHAALIREQFGIHPEPRQPFLPSGLAGGPPTPFPFFFAFAFSLAFFLSRFLKPSMPFLHTSAYLV